MENNLNQNLFLQQFNESNAIAYNKGFTSSTSDYNFQLLDNAYRNTGRIYAKLKLAIDSNKCQDETCAYELSEIKHLTRSSTVVLRLFVLTFSRTKRYGRSQTLILITTLNTQLQITL